MAVGHCAIELKVRALNTARNMLEGFLRLDENGRKKIVRDSYPRGEEEWQQVDNAIDEYKKLSSKVAVWEEDITMRINRGVRTQLSNPVTVRVQVASKHKERFEQVIRSFAGNLRDEVQDDLGRISTTMEPASPRREVGWIRRKGKGYRFAPAEGDEFHVPAKRNAGLYTIVMLIMNKDKEVPWKTLEMAESSGSPFTIGGAKTAEKIDVEYGEDRGYREDKGFAGDVADEATIASVGAETIRYEAELKAARKRGDKRQEKIAQDQLLRCEKYLLAAKSPGGKDPRQEITRGEEAGRKRTTMRISRAVERIGEWHREEARLIGASIGHKDGKWTYVPVQEPGWRIADDA
jgi:hypothetical protein